MWPNMSEEKINSLRCNSGLIVGEEDCHFLEMSDNDPSDIVFSQHGKEATQKVHINRFPWIGEDG